MTRKLVKIKVKELTYKRMFFILFLLMSVDVISSYIVTQHPDIYEVNVIAATSFSFGPLGLAFQLLFSVIVISFTLSFVYFIENKIFKTKDQTFRMRLLWLILGMYVFVFINNLKVIIDNIF